MTNSGHLKALGFITYYHEENNKTVFVSCVLSREALIHRKQIYVNGTMHPISQLSTSQCAFPLWYSSLLCSRAAKWSGL